MISAVPFLFWLLFLFSLIMTSVIVWLIARQDNYNQLSRKQLELTTTLKQLQQLQHDHQKNVNQLQETQNKVQTYSTQLTIAQTENRQLTVLQNNLYEQQQQNQLLIQQLQEYSNSLAAAGQQISYWQQQKQSWQIVEDEHQQLQQELNQIKIENSRLSTQLQQEQQTHQEKLALMIQARETLSDQFKTLANDILEEKSQRFSEQNLINLNQLLQPLNERMHHFNQLIQNTYEKETKERSILETELKRLQQLNTQLHSDAKALTDALTGTQNKNQGNWGEMILEKILESSGLQKGREYILQAASTIIDEYGHQKRLQPDVLIHLPNHKQIIIDAKMSLTAYVRYTQTDNAATAAHELAAHIKSVHQHIKELSAKNYTNIEGVNTLDFVFMFIPIEPAYLLVLQQDNQLFDECFNKGIMLVGPSTLLATLRTIANIWRNERQNQNAQEIAIEGGRLYDKLVGFVSTMETLDKNLKQTQEQFEKAMNQLHLGRGNLTNRAKKLHALGVKNSKNLPNHYFTEENEDDELMEITKAD